MDDADLQPAAEAIVTTGYNNAGQVCISAQRILATRKIYGDLIDASSRKSPRCRWRTRSTIRQSWDR